MASLDYVQNREWVIGYFATLTAITLGFCVIRTAVRLKHETQRFGFDDLFIALSWIISVCMTALTITGIVLYHFGRHLSDIAPNHATSALEYGWVLNIIYLAQTAFTKISILLFYRRLDPDAYSRRFKWAAWISMAVIAVCALVVFIIYLSDCLPFSAVWMQYDPQWASTRQFNCASRSQHIGTAWVDGLLAVATDLLTVALPSWLFVRHQLASKPRVALPVTLALGYLIAVPSIFRLVYLVRAQQPDTDKMWYTYTALIAGKTEADIGICLACGPTLNAFLRPFLSNHDERDEQLSIRDRSPPGSQDISRTRPSLRSNRSAVSDHSTRSVRFEKNTTSPDSSLRPGLTAQQVLKWSDKSRDDIPEAYAENIGAQQATDKEIEAGAGGERAVEAPRRPGTSQSWLNLDTESSDEERARRGKLKQTAHR